MSRGRAFVRRCRVGKGIFLGKVRVLWAGDLSRKRGGIRVGSSYFDLLLLFGLTGHLFRALSYV